MYLLIGRNLTAQELTFLNAVNQGNNNLVIECLNQGVNPNLTNDNGRTALYIAALQGNLEMVTTLVEGGAEINQPTLSGDIPLHGAASSNNVPLVRFLIAHNSELDTRNEHGISPWDLAKQAGHQGILNVRKECLQAKLQAFLHGKHPRLGDHSPVSKLVHDVIGMIAAEVIDPGLPEAGTIAALAANGQLYSWEDHN